MEDGYQNFAHFLLVASRTSFWLLVECEGPFMFAGLLEEMQIIK